MSPEFDSMMRWAPLEQVLREQGPDFQMMGVKVAAASPHTQPCAHTQQAHSLADRMRTRHIVRIIG